MLTRHWADFRTVLEKKKENILFISTPHGAPSRYPFAMCCQPKSEWWLLFNSAALDAVSIHFSQVTPVIHYLGEMRVEPKRLTNLGNILAMAQPAPAHV
jgi:hypothetical protein